MKECGEDDTKGMVSDSEGAQSLGGRDVDIHKQWDLCLCGGGGGDCGSGVGGGVDGSDRGGGVGGVDGRVGKVVLVMVVRVVCIRVVGVVGVLGIEVLEVQSVGVVDILVLGAVFVVELVERVELVVRCVVRGVLRLVVWCVNGRRYFLCCFSLKLVEMSRLSVGGFLFGMVLRADCFILLERDFLGNMVGENVLLDMVAVDVVVVETVDVVLVWFFVFFWCGYLRDMMGVRVVIEVVLGTLIHIIQNDVFLLSNNLSNLYH